MTSVAHGVSQQREGRSVYAIDTRRSGGQEMSPLASGLTEKRWAVVGSLDVG